jgi:hypothetical protein
MRTYLEIGTSDFDTLNDKLADRESWRGLSVEAVPGYFDRLRKHDKNAYVNAVCSASSAEPALFHYVPSDAIARHDLPFRLRGCGSRSLETQASLRDYRPHVQSQILPQVPIGAIIANDIFRDALTGRRRIDLLKATTGGCDHALVNAVLDQLRPTNVIFDTRAMSRSKFLSLDERLANLGYEYRGRGGDRVQYSRPSVLLVANATWSTGSIVRDLCCMSTKWDVDFLGWHKYPRDLEQLLGEYDAAACFTLPTPMIWPPMQRAGVLCCGPVEIEWAKNGHPFAEDARVKTGFGFPGRCIGAVSTDIYHLLTQENIPKRLYRTPASARASRFRRGDARPLRTLGWCGIPGNARSFGADLKRFSLFEEIVGRTGLQRLVTHQNYTYDTMQQFYDSIDMLVCTSSSEGGPLGVFEAIACGVPVISTDVGLVKEASSIAKFETAEQAAALVQRFREHPESLEAYRDAQRQEFEQFLCMERLMPLWDRFFDGCRSASPSALLT